MKIQGESEVGRGWAIDKEVQECRRMVLRIRVSVQNVREACRTSA